ncbi:MAG: hypothetical protein U9Q62_00860 [Campylobacterota bacterium]|nr:hypothetical protein [Campylobacterota bacterium]
MKWLAIIAGSLLTVVAALYILLFTPLGNGIIAPIVERKINASLSIESKLTTFELDSSSFTIELELTPENRIETVGNYSLFDQSLNALYRIRLNRLSALQSLTNTPLYGKLHTQGSVKGTLEQLDIAGESDIANSQTDYGITLFDFSPQNLKVTMKDAELESLFRMVGKKPYSTAHLAIDLDFKSIDPKNLDGSAVVTLLKGRVNTALMKEDFNLTLPKTTYAMKVTSQLLGETITYASKFESNLAYLFSQGKVTPEPLTTDLTYEINIKELALFKPITNAPLRGPFATKGTVKGDAHSMQIKGDSNVAASQTTYDVALASYKPQKVIAHIKNASLSKLLYLTGEPDYARGKINADITLNDLDPEHLSGSAKINLNQGDINTDVMKKHYGISLPETSFTYELESRLNGKQIDYTTYFNSNLAEIDSKGKVTPQNLGLDLDYRIAIEKLELLKPLTDAPLRGALSLKGTLKGDKKLLTLKGDSDLAKSDTSFKVELAEFQPKSIQAKIKHLQLKSLFYLVTQPNYANALINLDIDIPNAQKGRLDGKVTTQISRGVLNNKVIEKTYEFKKMPRVTFRGKTTTTLKGSLIDTKAEITSSLADFTLKNSRTDLDKSVTTAEYQAKVHNLDNLYFATERHLKGSMLITGDMKQAKDFDLHVHADTLGGTIDAALHNDDLKADIKGIQTLDTLHMLIYPEIFKSNLDGVLKYNLKTQKGTFDATLSKGKFTKNSMLDLVKQYGRVDLYKEQFKGNLKSIINKELIVTDMDLRSNRSSIITKKAKLNSKTKTVNAKIDINANKNPLGITLRGNVEKPKVEIDASRIIEKEGAKQLNKLFKKWF